MEMSIKDTKMHLVMQESYALGKDYRALENALNIIRKYERIQEIVKAWKADVDIDSYDCMVDIEEVIKDGNVD